jgi:transposase
VRRVRREIRFVNASNEGTMEMIVIGVDVHKRTHTLVAIDGQTGREHSQRTVRANDVGHLDALRFARGLPGPVVWAIEDCRHVSRRLEDALIAAGARVLRVAPALTGPSRRGQRQPGKSDPIDALAVARAVVREGVERFPVAFLDERAMEIRHLHDHREQLIAERTRMQNRLHFHLHQLDPDLEASLRRRTLDAPSAQAKIRRRLAREPESTQVRIARSQLTHIVRLTSEINELLAELDHLTAEHKPALRAETGCGPVTAAILIGQTAGAERFATEARFARQAGTAPIPASSGNTQRHRLHRGGNRQLNKALHIIAIVRARVDPETRAYLERQRANGKTSREALRCLKRYLARRVWRLLFADQPAAPGHTLKPAQIVSVGAPALMPCT